MNTELKPFSQACQNNRDPILHQLLRLFAGRNRVLEVGSGTGQHAVHFAAGLPELEWLTSDLAEHHEGIRLWLADYPMSNLRAPIVLDVSQPWPELPAVDAVYSANTAHIMAWPSVQSFFTGVGHLLPTGGLFVLYGPMNYGGHYTSDSNARFDVWLKAQDPSRGIRDIEKLQGLAMAVGMSLVEDIEMPANNRLLVWQKV